MTTMMTTTMATMTTMTYTETNLVDNSLYYAYILCYVDDILVMHHDPTTVLKEIHG